MADLNYPFDPTGTNPANRIVDEVHVITPATGNRRNFRVLKKGPFFEGNVSIVFVRPDTSIWNMVEGVDYYFSHKFLTASKACGKEIFGSITFLNNQVQGTLRVSYNTVGGNWGATDPEYAAIMADIVNNPRTTTWEEVVDLPFQFPVIDHEWDLVDMVGMSDVVAKLDEIYDVLFETSDAGIQTHINDTSNPHLVTKAQVNLGNVQNYGIATTQEMQTGTSTQAYMTPALVKAAVAFHGANLVDAHASRTDNPHQMTKAQLGLGSVDNYPTASSSEATTGTASNRFMTPALTKAAFDAFNTSNVSHLADLGNPHQTTKDQVGLNLVQNYSMATLPLAQAGTNTTSYMSPSTTAGAISFQALVPLNAHTANNSNPHGTTKAQVGLASVEDYPIATPTQASELTSNAAYMTPLRTRQAIEAFSSQQFEFHTEDMENPHQTTAEQVGAYTTGQVDTLLTGLQNNINTVANGLYGRLIAIRTLTTTNNGQNYAETAGTKFVLIKMSGGGASGGSSYDTDSTHVSHGSGGGAGGFAEGFFPIADITGKVITVGAGGVACPANATPTSAQNGGDTSIGTAIRANGGVAGSSGSVPVLNTASQILPPGANGIGHTGSLLMKGLAEPMYALTIAGEGISGRGGVGVFGSGGEAVRAAANNSALGITGTGFGSGGSGAASNISSSGRAGGAGRAGVIYVYEFG